MSRTRFLLAGLLKLCLAFACLVGAIAAYRLVLDPLVGSGLALGERAASIVRRASIFAAIVLSYWAFVRYYERRFPQELSLPWRRMALAAVAGSASIGLTILVLFAAGSYQALSFRAFGPAIGVLGTIWVAAVLEEVAFRGILFRLLEERIGTGAAWAGSAVIFCLAHVSNSGFRWVTLLSVTLAGLMWTGLFVVWRNLWVVAIHHCCWNATIFLTGLPLSGERWQAPVVTVSRGPILWTGGAFGPEDALLNLLVSAAICLALWRLARQADAPQGLEALAPAPPDSG